ncbi:hypothetical protein E7T09_08180 [Deinococcus sp. KSM4-11]|uniref:hypothetical protein n=1 Tax=Deinococcus sp. KSM4-11 TaxID=2568654 RepID=UPI0010A3413A|nr:hypothetical protein [Deinococcus sp. KSM4-11]THF87131.1 hypothetical protein E7T09_08180 [Deinococcus sp. KSM4-11]
MDVHVPEFELRWRMAVRLLQALPLLLALVIVAGLALTTLHAPLYAIAVGSGLSGLLAALAVVRSVTWAPGTRTPREAVPTTEPLTSA